MHLDGRIYITGTPGPRDWFANLLAEPRFVFHLKESVHADLDANAVPVDDPTERRELFEAVVAEWYITQTSLETMIERAPLVRVTFG